MAVSYANALVRRTERSYLCCTRLEGMLKNELSPEVGYLFLEKRSSLDPKAFLRLRCFIRSSHIDIIQAHSSSWFLALLVKWSLPGLKLVWHDHYGLELRERKPGILKLASGYFDGIFCVNPELKKWAKQQLFCPEVHYLRNFLPAKEPETPKIQKLSGEGFRIICVANLRPQKDHLNLLKAFKILSGKYPDLSLHLIGGAEYTACAEEVKDFIKHNKLENKVVLYGAKSGVAAFLAQADLGVLSSRSEGLPVALLEYGRAGLPVVCTRVGECAEVIGNHGKSVPSRNPEALAFAIEYYMKEEDKRKEDARNFQRKIRREFSEESVMQEMGLYFKELLNV